MKPHWDAIARALGQPPSALALDEPEETWFGADSGKLDVWSMGVLHTHARVDPRAACSERHLLYHYRHHLYVELALYPRGVVVTCSEANGRLIQFVVDGAEVEGRLAHYRALGFRPIGPWHHDERTAVVRTFANSRERAAVRVSGSTLSIEREDQPFEHRADAEQAAETWIAELLRDGYELVRMWTAGSAGNPPRVDPPLLPTLTDLPGPSTPHEAVDLAVQRLRELHELFPTANLVMELITDPQTDRLEQVAGLGPEDWQWQRLGRWLDLPEIEPTPSSSFDYFLARYGTLSWFLREGWDVPREVYTHRSNGHSGPDTPLEILPAETLPLLEDLASHKDDPDYLKLKIFMANEECEGFAFDTRFTSPTGEHLIVWFEAHMDPELTGDASDPIVPFGTWLFDKVETLTEQLLPWLALVDAR